MTNDLFAQPRLIALALQQAGAFARAQLASIVSERRVDYAIATGRLIERAPGVYALPTSPQTFIQDVWVAVLAVGARCGVGFEAGARLRRLATFAATPSPTLLVPNGDHARVAGSTIHQTRDTWPVAMSQVDGLPVTTVERTFVDLAAVIRRGRLSLVLDDAVASKLTTYGAVGTQLKLVARRGKPGVRLLTTVLDERGPGTVPPFSDLERDLMGLFDRYGGARPKLAWPYPGRFQVNGCADAGFAEALLAVETDGRRWHDRIAQRKLDIDRDNEACRHGVQVLRLLHEHVVGDPRGTWQLIQDTRAIRLSQLTSSNLQAIAHTECGLLPAERGRLSA